MKDFKDVFSFFTIKCFQFFASSAMSYLMSLFFHYFVFTVRLPNSQLVVQQKCVWQRCLLQKELEAVRTKVTSSKWPLLTTLAKVLSLLFHILAHCLFPSVIILFVHSLPAAASLEGELCEVEDVVLSTVIPEMCSTDVHG